MQKEKSRRIKHNESGFHFLVTGNLRIFICLKLGWGTNWKHTFYYEHNGLQHSNAQKKCILMEWMHGISVCATSTSSCAIMYNISEKRHQIFNRGKYLFTITSCECNICEKSFIQSRKQSVRKGEEILRLFLIHL